MDCRSRNRGSHFVGPERGRQMTCKTQIAMRMQATVLSSQQTGSQAKCQEFAFRAADFSLLIHSPHAQKRQKQISKRSEERMQRKSCTGSSCQIMLHPEQKRWTTDANMANMRCRLSFVDSVATIGTHCQCILNTFSLSRNRESKGDAVSHTTKGKLYENTKHQIPFFRRKKTHLQTRQHVISLIQCARREPSGSRQWTRMSPHEPGIGDHNA